MSVAKELFFLGVSFRTAPAAVREALSFNAAEATALFDSAKVEMPEREVVVVSTCNRTEFYLAAAPNGGVPETWLRHLRKARPQAPIFRKECHLYQMQGMAAVNHLFRVACGLDSAILGDAQILGQVKQALGDAGRRGSLGGYLHRVFDQALAVGKRARRETAISSGAAGIGSALAGLVVSRLTPRPETAPTVLIVGAGETARSITRHLSKRGAWCFLFINRTEEKARELAIQYGGNSRSWSEMETALNEADLVITATSSPQPLLRRELLEGVVRKRLPRPLLIVDAGLPRNIEPGAALELIEIDQIRGQREITLGLRQTAVPVVERNIDDELQSWAAWKASRPVEEAIKQLYLDAAHHRGELSRQVATTTVVPLDQADHMVWHSLRKVLHSHARRLRGLGPGPGRAMVTRRT